MRNFYIFNINQEYTNLTRCKPYTLFKTFEEIYNLSINDYLYGIDIYENIVIPLNKKKLSNDLFEDYKKDDHYSKFMYTHLYNNYFSEEKSSLDIHNSYMLLKTNSIRSKFFNFLSDYNHLFVCDFQNKDYFWLESIA